MEDAGKLTNIEIVCESDRNCTGIPCRSGTVGKFGVDDYVRAYTYIHVNHCINMDNVIHGNQGRDEVVAVGIGCGVIIEGVVPRRAGKGIAGISTAVTQLQMVLPIRLLQSYSIMRLIRIRTPALKFFVIHMPDKETIRVQVHVETPLLAIFQHKVL